MTPRARLRPDLDERPGTARRRASALALLERAEDASMFDMDTAAVIYNAARDHYMGFPLESLLACVYVAGIQRGRERERRATGRKAKTRA